MFFQNQWSSVFCGIVSRAMTIEVLSTGVAGNYNGALQVVTNNYLISFQLYAVIISIILSYLTFRISFVDDSRVPGPISSRPYSRKLFCEVL